jgi:hypothetical protein
MIRPVEQQDRLKPAEYVNRVQKAEHNHEAGSRDFGLEVKEASRDDHKHHPKPHDFGQDSYESSQESEPQPEASRLTNATETSGEDTNLDIVV